METLWQDLKFGARMLIRNRGVTVVAAIALALGIGGNTAIFSIVDALLLRPLPYDEPERLVAVWGYHPEIGREELSLPDFADLRAGQKSFESMAAATLRGMTLTGVDEPDRVVAAPVTGNFFAVLRTPPMLGRGFLPEEDRPGGPNVVVLGYKLWQSKFGGDRAILGRDIILEGRSYTVVGVAPARLQLPPEADLWLPLARDPADAGRRSDFLVGLGRLKPGVSLVQAQADLRAIMVRLEKEYPPSNAGWTANVLPLHEQVVHDVRPALLILLGAVGFVLLIACTNVANMLLARSSARERELAIRVALGAGRGRLLRLLLSESVLLAFLGGTLGVLLAFWGLDALLAASPAGVPRMDTVQIDLRILGFTALLSLAVGLLFGLAPALHASRTDVNESLKEGSRGVGTDRGRRTLRRLLVVSEVALSLMLLVGAGLTIRSLYALMNVDPGFNRSNLLTMRVPLPSAQYSEREQIVPFYERFLERLRAVPGVRAATLASPVPLSGGLRMWAFSIEGRPDPPPEVIQDASVLLVSGNYVETMQIPLLQGRGLEPRDVQGKASAALINRAMARRYFPDQSPIGQRLTFNNPTSPDAVWLTIVGVTADVRQTAMEQQTYPSVYAPYNLVRATNMGLILRTDGDPLALAPTVRGLVSEMDSNVAIYAIRTMDQVLAVALQNQRFAMALLSIFAGVALVLAAVGIYGVMSYLVTQRTHEIGVRMALGAQRKNIFALVVGEAFLLTSLGLVAGLAASFGLTRFLGKLIFGVPPTDPLTFVGVSLLLAAVALLACYVPARRATRVDPIAALRYE